MCKLIQNWQKYVLYLELTCVFKVNKKLKKLLQRDPDRKKFTRTTLKTKWTKNRNTES